MSAAAQAAVATPAAPAPETIADVLASDNLDQFRDDAPETEEPAAPAPAPKAKPGKAARKPAKMSKLQEANGDEGPGDDTEEERDPADEDTVPDVKKPAPDTNEEAEEAAFSEEALATPEGLAAAREIVRAARAAAEKRNHVLDRYDMRSKNRLAEAKQLKEASEARSQQVETVAQAIARDLHIFREPGMTAKEKLGALSRLAGGRPGHEVLDELTAGILSDGKEQPADPRVRELEQRLATSEQRWAEFLQQQEAAKVQGQTEAQKRQIAQVFTQIQEEAADAETYPTIAAGLDAEDWTPEEVAELVAGADGLMVKHFRRTGERLDKSEALRILDGRLARYRGTVERAPQGVTGIGTAKRPGSPARGAGRGTTITPSVADRSAGSVRTLETREKRLADLQRDPAALKQLFPMLG